MVERRQMGPLEDDPRAFAAAVKKHRCWWSILMWAALATLHAQFTVVGGLKNVRVVSPGAVAVGENAALECQYDLEGAELYAVKWYKGKKEFYRYLPKEDPPTKVFPLPGINVDLSESDAHHVVLRDAGFTLTGRYRCEVSADAPSFDTALVVASLVIVDKEGKGDCGGEEKAEISAKVYGGDGEEKVEILRHGEDVVVDSNLNETLSEEGDAEGYRKMETTIGKQEDKEYCVKRQVGRGDIGSEKIECKMEQKTERVCGQKENEVGEEDKDLEYEQKLNLMCFEMEREDANVEENGMKFEEGMGVREYVEEKVDDLERKKGEGEGSEQKNGDGEGIKGNWSNENCPTYEKYELNIECTEDGNKCIKGEEANGVESGMRFRHSRKGGLLRNHFGTSLSNDEDEGNEECNISFTDEMLTIFHGMDLHEKVLRYSELVYEVISSVLNEVVGKLKEVDSFVKILQEHEEIEQDRNYKDEMADPVSKHLENAEEVEMDEEGEDNAKGLSKSIKGIQINGRWELKENGNDVINYTGLGEEDMRNGLDIEKTESRERLIDFYEDRGEVEGTENEELDEKGDGFDEKTLSYLQEVGKESEVKVNIDEEMNKEEKYLGNNLKHVGTEEGLDEVRAKEVKENLQVHSREKTFYPAQTEDENIMASEEENPKCENAINCDDESEEDERERGREKTLEGHTENTGILGKGEEVRCSATYKNESEKIGVREGKGGSSLSLNSGTGVRNKEGIEDAKRKVEYEINSKELKMNGEKNTDTSYPKKREEENLGGQRWNNKDMIKEREVEDCGMMISRRKGEEVEGEDVDNLDFRVVDEGTIGEEELEGGDYQINEVEEKEWERSTPEWRVKSRSDEVGEEGDEGYERQCEKERKGQASDGTEKKKGREFKDGEEATKESTRENRGILMRTCHTKDNCDRAALDQNAEEEKKKPTEDKPGEETEEGQEAKDIFYSKKEEYNVSQELNEHTEEERSTYNNSMIIDNSEDTKIEVETRVEGKVDAMESKGKEKVDKITENEDWDDACEHLERVTCDAVIGMVEEEHGEVNKAIKVKDGGIEWEEERKEEMNNGREMRKKVGDIYDKDRERNYDVNTGEKDEGDGGEETEDRNDQWTPGEGKEKKGLVAGRQDVGGNFQNETREKEWEMTETNEAEESECELREGENEENEPGCDMGKERVEVIGDKSKGTREEKFEVGYSGCNSEKVREGEIGEDKRDNSREIVLEDVKGVCYESEGEREEQRGKENAGSGEFKWEGENVDGMEMRFRSENMSYEGARKNFHVEIEEEEKEAEELEIDRGICEGMRKNDTRSGEEMVTNAGESVSQEVGGHGSKGPIMEEEKEKGGRDWKEEGEREKEKEDGIVNEDKEPDSEIVKGEIEGLREKGMKHIKEENGKNVEEERVEKLFQEEYKDLDQDIVKKTEKDLKGEEIVSDEEIREPYDETGKAERMEEEKPEEKLDIAREEEECVHEKTAKEDIEKPMPQKIVENEEEVEWSEKDGGELIDNEESEQTEGVNEELEGDTGELTEYHRERVQGKDTPAIRENETGDTKENVGKGDGLAELKKETVNILQ